MEDSNLHVSSKTREIHMKDINVTLSISETTRDLEISADTLEFGSQFDNKATKLVFIRPGELSGRTILLVFSSSFGKQKFTPIPIAGEDFIVTNLFTQGQRLYLQVIAEIDSEEVRSNVLEFTLRPSIVSFNPPPIEIPLEPESDDFVPSIVVAESGTRAEVTNTGDNITWEITLADEAAGTTAAMKLSETGLTLNGDEVYTKTQVEDALAAASLSDPQVLQVVDLIYPIGHLLITVNDINPGVLYPGTEWRLWGQGRLLMGVDPSQADKSASERTGGTSEVKLTTDNIPAHHHTYTAPQDAVFHLEPGNGDATMSVSAGGRNTSSVGNNAPFSIMPPFITAYMWLRVAPTAG